jgi:hypothetical protein
MGLTASAKKLPNLSGEEGCTMYNVSPSFLFLFLFLFVERVSEWVGE